MRRGGGGGSGARWITATWPPSTVRYVATRASPAKKPPPPHAETLRGAPSTFIKEPPDIGNTQRGPPLGGPGSCESRAAGCMAQRFERGSEYVEHSTIRH